MQYQETSAKLAQYREQIIELRKQMRELQQAIQPENVKDYEFVTVDGAVRLSQLFGSKEHLFVIHNMGAGCAYCTLWADGFNGILKHIENRAAFVLSTPDDPARQHQLKASREWRFRMVSHQNSQFAADMGYRKDNSWVPGVSVFKRDGDQIVRVSDTRFGPYDDFCSIWHFMDMIPEGANGWQPRMHSCKSHLPSTS
jgi:predicted dithiol-disulfide oxidoreductase (DUF899 family)